MPTRGNLPAEICSQPDSAVVYITTGANFLEDGIDDCNGKISFSNK